MTTRPAECFPLCDYLHDELAARGWSRQDLLGRVAIGEARAAEILRDEGGPILMHEAEQLGRAFDVAPEVFLRLQVAYRNWKNEATDHGPPTIARPEPTR